MAQSIALLANSELDPTEHDSEEAAREAFAEYVRELGTDYFIWFAYLYDDEGNLTRLANPVPFI